jgi:hypothetical protein
MAGWRSLGGASLSTACDICGMVGLASPVGVVLVFTCEVCGCKCDVSASSSKLLALIT